MWGFIPLAGWASMMKISFHRTSAPEKSNPRLADERLPREVPRRRPAATSGAAGQTR